MGVLLNLDFNAYVRFSLDGGTVIMHATFIIGKFYAYRKITI
jgi:hypothetical protein